MICERWETVVVPFPFLEKPVTKRRPALVISDMVFNAANDHSVLVMITSATAGHWLSDCEIADLELAGLTVTCRVRWKVFTLPNELIDRRLGMLSGADRHACSKQMRVMLGQ